MDRRNLLFLILITVNVSEIVLPETVTVTFEEAVAKCIEKGQNLASVSQISQHLRLVAGDEAYWLPYRKSSFTIWTWVDGTKFAYSIGEEGTSVPHQDCAVVRTLDSILDASDCYKGPKRHYMCDIHGSNCPNGVKCITVNNKNRTVHYNRSTWFEARNDCKRHKGDLVNFRGLSNKEIINKVTEAIHASSMENGHFWIGLSRIQWKALSGDSEIPVYNWTAVVDSSLDCAAISRDLAWQTTDCGSKHKFLCNDSAFEHTESEIHVPLETTLAKKLSSEFTTPLNTLKPDSMTFESFNTSNDTTTWIGKADNTKLAIGLGIFLFLAAILVVGLVLYRKREHIMRRCQYRPPNNQEEAIEMN